jgi:hypothetical protein
VHVPRARLLLLCAAAAAAVTATAASARPAAPRLESPRVAEIALAGAPITDRTLSSSTASSLLVPGTYWGGTFTASTGERVTAYFSNRYPQDPAAGQRWANFFASLVHGSELSSLTSYLAPLDEVQRACGSGALACYNDRDNLLVAPGTDPAFDLSAEAVATHEYGHHVAAHRLNDPWPAIAYGPKRWASYEQVCSLARAKKLFPGAEQSPLYELNPGEGWAETYRVLNERKAGLTEPPWDIVDQSLYPDAGALSLAEQDVTSPWQKVTTTQRGGSVTRAKRVRNYSVATSLDGSLSVTLRTPARARLSLDLYGGSTRIGHAVGRGTVSISTDVCGARTLRIRVGRLSGAGAFHLAIAKP